MKEQIFPLIEDNPCVAPIFNLVTDKAEFHMEKLNFISKRWEYKMTYAILGRINRSNV